MTSTDIRSGRLSHEELAENFADHHPPLSSSNAKVEADRCYFCYDAPCIDACPTQALDEYILDSSKCISYLTIEHRGDFTEEEDNLSGWIYGCDICQEVCPWNISFSKISDESYFEPREKIVNNTDQDWRNLF